MKDNPYDPDSPLWTAEDFAHALSADRVLPPRLASLLVRPATRGLRDQLSGQSALARGIRIAA